VKLNISQRQWRRSLLIGTALVVLAGCQTLGLDGPTAGGGIGEAELSEMLNQPRAIPALVKKGEAALKAKDLDRAQRLFSAALKLDITNPDLQFLNGLTYHLIGVSKDRTKLELAEQGLKLALKFDPGHLAARYQLGLLYMDQRRFALAQGHFAAAVLHRPNDPAMLYNLAAASYYSHDPRMAEAALNQLAKATPDAVTDADVLWAQALVMAALNDKAAAKNYLNAFRDRNGDDKAAFRLEGRLSAWRGFYDHDLKLTPAQFSNQPAYQAPGTANPYGSQQANPYGSQQANPYGAQQANPYGQTGGVVGQSADDTGMVVVDVVIIGTQEDVRESRGINLLNGLQLQFGDPTTGAYGFSYSRNNINDKIDSGLDENTSTITNQIGIPAVTYSLNIANSADSDNEILAKPSLTAQSGRTSEFFSGTEILAAAVSGGDGDSVSVQKEVGVKLAVTPEILDDNFLRLHVVAERTFLTDPASSVLFEFRLDTTKTNVNSTVTMRFGETLILGGLSERETSKSSDGVPGLMDIPGLNYFFSERTKRNFERSILILLTPRRPQYTRQSEENRNKTRDSLSDLEKDLERLHKRHQDWFTPRPTFNSVIERMTQKEFFEEFRSGDFRIKAWNENPRNMEHIARIQDRLTRN
jgi:general secretion pathway protein D